MASRIRYAILTLLAVTSTQPGSAVAESEITRIEVEWKACQDLITKAPDEWVGWRRTLAGDGDTFSFWQQYSDPPQIPAVLRVVNFIDGSMAVTTFSCFRNDGSLAFIFTSLDSPNGRDKSGASPTRVKREGRIYVSGRGNVLKVVGQIIDPAGASHSITNDDWQPMLPCEPVDLYRNTGEVEKAYLAELGDEYGNRPPFKPSGFDWCVDAKAP